MNKGFFTKKETESKSRPKGKTYSCASCGLLPNTLNPCFGVTGKGRKEIMIIGSSNTKSEDERMKHWQGTSGRLVKSIFSDQDIDISNDCWSLNAVSCVCKDPKGVTGYQVECCRKNVEKAIKKYNPKLIFILGNNALYSLIGNKYSGSLGEFKKWRGFTIPDFEHNCWLCPISHPDYIVNSKGKESELVWEQDIQNALTKLNKKLPNYDKPKIIDISDDLSPLLNIERGVVSIDYETTGLKPHAAGHQIVCASVAVGPTYAYTFMIPQNRSDLLPFIRLLQNPNVGKMAHNMKYEDAWTNVRLKTEVANWEWDSMQAAHIIDNRQGICGLKFLSFICFGVGDYSSEISPYLKGVDKKNANSLNRVLELCETGDGRKKLLHYCGLDTIYQYRLAILQQDEILAPF